MSHSMLRIPRGTRILPTANEYWGLVRKHGRSRKSMVNFITSIGGYADRNERYAIEWNIKDYYSDCDADNLWKLLLSFGEGYGPDTRLPIEELAQIKALFCRVYEADRDAFYSRALEDAYTGWADSDTPFSTFTGDTVPWEWDVLGRMGGHLCMKNCAGIDTRCSPEELEERLNEYEEGFPRRHVIKTSAVRDLFIICVQNTVDLDSRNISREIEHATASAVWSYIEGKDVDDLLFAYRSRGRMSDELRTALNYLSGHIALPPGGASEEVIDAFKTICTLADVSLGEWYAKAV